MLSVRLSHKWCPIWGMKWNVVCPSQSYVVSNMRNEMKCCLSVCLSYVVSNMRNEMKCLSVCQTLFPIWGMKWNVVCPSVIRGFQYEECNEMLSVRLSYVDSNMRNDIKSLSVCHTWFPIRGMKWNVCPSQLYMVSIMRNEMKCMSVCHTWIQIWGMTKCMCVCHTWFPIWGMKWNAVCPFQSYMVSNMRNEMKCMSVCHTWIQIWGMTKCMSVCHTWFPIWGMKCNVVCPSQSYVVSNMRNKMRCLSVCHTWFPIWGMKCNVVCPSVIRCFQYEEWNEMSVRLSYVVSNKRNEMKYCLSVSVIRGFQ